MFGEMGFCRSGTSTSAMFRPLSLLGSMLITRPSTPAVIIVLSSSDSSPSIVAHIRASRRVVLAL